MLKNKTSIVCDFKVDRSDCHDGKDIFLPPNQKYNLTIDYPCNKSVFTISTGKSGLGTMGLVKKISKLYERIYSKPFHYGVWGHGIEDLVIERIHVDNVKKRITLDVGS